MYAIKADSDCDAARPFAGGGRAFVILDFDTDSATADPEEPTRARL